MRVFKEIKGLRLLLPAVLFLAATGAAAQDRPPKSLEISESDGVPVLVKHLPDWENAKQTAVFASSTAELKRFLGDRPVLGLIDLSGGTEAVTANYGEGTLLLVEFATPQGSAEADARIQEFLVRSPQDPPLVYRRIGNYNAFVFDAADQDAASALLDQIKYEKQVQWLGENPFEFKRMERAFVYTTRDIFVATVLWIILGLLGSAAVGVGVGYLYFLFREKQRARLTRFSDAGGMTKLNLDDLSEPFSNN